MNAFAADPDFTVADGDPVPAGAFSPDGGTTWIPFYQQEQDDPYIFTPNGYQKGIIAFNPAVGNITVNNDFQLNGTSFEIRTNEGQTVAFAQPLSNYQTAVTLTGQGTIETQGAAAFGQVTVGSGKAGDAPTLKIDSQIGVIGGISVAKGATLTLDDGSTLLLTKQIANAGTVNIVKGAVIDASNVTRELAEGLGIQLLTNLDPKGDVHGDLTTVPNGYLYGGTDASSFKITTGNGTVNSDSGTLRIGVVDFTIGEAGVVTNDKTHYEMWLQNGGTGNEADIVDARNRQGLGAKMSVMVRGGSTESPTTLLVEDQFGSNYQIYVARNAVADITLANDIWEWKIGGVGDLKVLDGAQVFITTLVDIVAQTPPDTGRITRATFVGQNITLTSVALEGVQPASHNFSPLALTVENASSVLMNADIHAAYGYLLDKGAEGQILRDIADYRVKGVLTMASGYTMDMTAADRESSTKAADKSQIGNVPSEQFAHLVIEENGKVVLQQDALFTANTVTNESELVDVKVGEKTICQNLDTARTYSGNDVESNYEINGTIEVRGRSGSGKNATSITAIEGAEHYTTRNSGFTITNAYINVVDTYIDGYIEVEDPVTMIKFVPNNRTGSTDTTISNVLIGDSVTNAKENHGTVTLDNAANQDFNLIYAKEGNIAITNRNMVETEGSEQQPETVNAARIRIGAGKTVSVCGTLEEEAKKATLNVSNLLQADGYRGDPENPSYSVVDANLRLGVGTTLNVSAANGIGGIDMNGNTVTFGYEESNDSRGAWLYWADYDSIMGMAQGSKYDLFLNVSGVDLSDLGHPSPEIMPEEGESAVDASLYFTNLPSNNFYLCYSGDGGTGGKGENVGTIYIYKWGTVTPEPTTGTLSLLALAALAARRRRK